MEKVEELRQSKWQKDVSWTLSVVKKVNLT